MAKMQRFLFCYDHDHASIVEIYAKSRLDAATLVENYLRGFNDADLYRTMYRLAI